MSGTEYKYDQLLDELFELPQSSESLPSVDSLREIIERYGCERNKNNNWRLREVDYGFFTEFCANDLVTEEILRCLLEYFPDAASFTDEEQCIPLHMICFNKNATRDMVQLLIDASPGLSIDKAKNDGVTPLHFLCANKLEDSFAVDILGLILDKCPEAARHADGDGSLPIHVAVMSSKSVEFCRMLIEAYPGSERIAENGRLPLHIACKCGTVETAEYLLRLYPESINVANEEGRYPIHYAIMRLKGETPASAVGMVQFLLDHDSNLALQKWDDSTFLLFASVCIACNNRNDASIFNAALKILHLFYDAHPEVIEDDEISAVVGRRDVVIPEEIQTFISTQLTYARQARNSTARQMKTRDENGQVPLHRAIQDSATLGSIKLLVKRNPSVILIPDNSGAMPLHVAIQHHDSPKVVDYLVGLDPNTLTAVDRDGNTALHIACRGAKYDTIALLLEKSVSVSQGNVCNKLPIHLLFESNSVANRENDTKYLESVFQLLRANPETVMLPGDEKQQTTRNGGRPSRSGKKRKYCA